MANPDGQTSDKRKQSLYFPEEMLREIQAEAARQDRSLSWIVQRAWIAARSTIGKMPGMDGLRAGGATAEDGTGADVRHSGR